MDQSEVIRSIEEVAEAIGGELCENYSGRGMYGAQCLGTEFANP